MRTLLILLAMPIFAADLYFSPTAVGGNTGTSCANAYAYNDSTNGINGTGTASWVAGNVLHLCGGTWSGANGQQWVSSHGVGSNGDPITIKFEPDAILSAPYHSVNGAIDIGNNYVTVDGGTNGIVQNTANGTQGSPNCVNGSCSMQQASILVRITSGSNVEIKNLTLAGAYVNDSTTNNNDTAGQTTYGIYSLGNAGVTLDHNVCHDAQYCFTVWGAGTVINYNTFYSTAWDIGSGINAPVTGLRVDHNSFTKNCAWYTTSDLYHLNNVHIFANSGTGNYSGVAVYDNYFAGGCNLGAQTAKLYMEGSYTNPQIFNNIFDNQGTPSFFFPSLRFGTGGSWTVANPLIVNNTFIGSDYTTSGSTDFYYDSNVTGMTFQNNVVTGGKTLLALGTGGSFATGGINNNAYDATNNSGTGNPFSYDGVAYATFALYKAALPAGSGQESASIIQPFASLNINSNGTLAPGSSAIGIGVNLTSIGISMLNLDAAGIARPATGPWDIGAYQYAAIPSVSGFLLSGGVMK